MTDLPPQHPPEEGLRARPGIRDALYGLLFMFPAAGLTALVYRFPIPFDGYARGPSGVWDAMLATLFYGLVGGFIVVPALAATAGWAVRRTMRPGPALSALVPVAVALAYAVVVALLGLAARG